MNTDFKTHEKTQINHDAGHFIHLKTSSIRGYIGLSMLGRTAVWHKL